MRVREPCRRPELGQIAAARAGIVASRDQCVERKARERTGWDDQQVRTGDQVTAGQPLVALEAMKMEHVVHAPIDGVVAEVLVDAGEQVDTGQALLVVEPVAVEPVAVESVAAESSHG